MGPRREPAFAAEGCQSLIHRYKDLLKRLLGVGPVAREVEAKAEHWLSQTSKDLLERRFSLGRRSFTSMREERCLVLWFDPSRGSRH
jgi:hypothetical protein